jgi:hypothetical protein
MTSRILIASSAVILLYLGSVHLAYTLLTHKFNPTEGQLESSMKQVAPRISNEMTMWKAWMGFNVSHSMGLLLFGLIYGYMVVYRWEVLRTSYFLAGTGLLMLVGYVVLARIFWFTAPLIGVSAATLLYVVGFVYALARP